MAQIRANNEYYETHSLVTSDGAAVTTENPLPVTLGSENITITGDVNLVDTISVNSTQEDPVHTHLTEVGTSGILEIPNLPISIQNAAGDVNSAINPVFVQGTTTSSFMPTQNDAFGRLRVSNPFTLFDSSHRFKDNNLWATATTGTATATFNANQGLVDLTVNGALNAEVIRETTKVFSYQPGKSLLIMTTFVMSPAKAGLRQRVGYYGAKNGIYLELDGSVLSFVKRSFVSGSLVNTSIEQSTWNIDTLDGDGPSGITLDISKAQILWMDIEWLGVGSVRLGFVIDGQFIHCHTIHHANIITSTYITTASLPLRYEIKNTTATSGSSTMKQICSTVISEGGYVLSGTQQAIGIPVNLPRTLGTAGTFYPVVSLRLKASGDFLDAIVIITALSVMPISTAAYNWQIRAAGTITGGTWTDAGVDSAVQYNITGTSNSGGRILASGYFSASNQGTTQIDILKEALFKFQLERNSLTSTPYELTLVVASNSSDDTVVASMDWEEISR